MTKILDGKWLSKLYQLEFQEEVEELRTQAGRVPGLGVILVGDNPASKAYVAGKEKYAKGCGFVTVDVRLPQDTTEEKLKGALLELNKSEIVDGILLQLPLPKHLDSSIFLDMIDPKKDADGLHPVNQGLLMRGAGVRRPCTPVGVMKLIDLAYSDFESGQVGVSVDDIPKRDLSGKRAVVIGRSILVGKAAGFLLLERNATVTFAHSKSPDLKALTREADIVVAAVGVPKLVKGDWIKKGTVVIDVGINRIEDGSLVGDVDFDSVSPQAGAITPVPGGCGPMTITMLMQNTLASFKEKML